MSRIPRVDEQKNKSNLAIVISAVLPVVVGSLALVVQGRYTLKIHHQLD